MRRNHAGPESSVLRLRDGRQVGFATFGDPDGAPVVNAHGGLAGRLDVLAASTAARQAGIRLVSPDRPGIGLSDPLPRRTMLDWAHDVEELAEHLGIDRFGVMGWSMGGQYAAALGYALPARVHRVAIVAGAVPLTEPGVLAELGSMDRAFTRLSAKVPVVARAAFGSMGLLAAHLPRAFTRMSARGLGAADAEVIAGEPVENFSAMTADALRSTRGMVEEYRAWARPWGFAPEDLKVPVDVWWGEDDRLVPRRWVESLAQRIPGASLHVRAGGHFMAHRHYAEILAPLVPQG